MQGWNLVTEDGMMKLQRTWKVKTFMKGMEFFKLVADVAEAEGNSYSETTASMISSCHMCEFKMSIHFIECFRSRRYPTF